jgi:hypothetical protein
VKPRRGLHIHATGLRGDIIDDGGHLRESYGLGAGDWILVRPDGYIGGGVSSDNISSLDAYLDSVGLPRFEIVALARPGLRRVRETAELQQVSGLRIEDLDRDREPEGAARRPREHKVPTHNYQACRLLIGNVNPCGVQEGAHLSAGDETTGDNRHVCRLRARHVMRHHKVPHLRVGDLRVPRWTDRGLAGSMQAGRSGIRLHHRHRSRRFFRLSFASTDQDESGAYEQESRESSYWVHLPLSRPSSNP